MSDPRRRERMPFALKWRAFWWGFKHPFADPRRSLPQSIAESPTAEADAALLRTMDILESTRPSRAVQDVIEQIRSEIQARRSSDA